MVINSTKNAHQSAVAKDIRDAILKKPAGKGVSAVYQTKGDQETRLTAAFDKWAKRTDVWSTTAAKVCGCTSLSKS